MRNIRLLSEDMTTDQEQACNYPTAFGLEINLEALVDFFIV